MSSSSFPPLVPDHLNSSGCRIQYSEGKGRGVYGQSFCFSDLISYLCLPEQLLAEFLNKPLSKSALYSSSQKMSMKNLGSTLCWTTTRSYGMMGGWHSPWVSVCLSILRQFLSCPHHEHNRQARCSTTPRALMYHIRLTRSLGPSGTPLRVILRPTRNCISFTGTIFGSIRRDPEHLNRMKA